MRRRAAGLLRDCVYYGGFIAQSSVQQCQPVGGLQPWAAGRGAASRLGASGRVSAKRTLCAAAQVPEEEFPMDTQPLASQQALELDAPEEEDDSTARAAASAATGGDGEEGDDDAGQGEGEGREAAGAGDLLDPQVAAEVIGGPAATFAKAAAATVVGGTAGGGVGTPPMELRLPARQQGMGRGRGGGTRQGGGSIGMLPGLTPIRLPLAARADALGGGEGGVSSISGGGRDPLSSLEHGESFKEEVDLGGTKFILEVGRLARLADGSCLAALGDTRVLVTVVADRGYRDDRDSLPLTVDYRERLYAVGRIPPTYNRREGAPKDRELIVGRAVDRALRPLFPQGFNYETQITAEVLSADGSQDPDLMAINAASAALCCSDVPWSGPIAAVRVSLLPGGQWVINPPPAQRSDAELTVTYVGTQHRVVSLEAEGQEVSEELFCEALTRAKRAAEPLLEPQARLARRAGRAKRAARLWRADAAAEAVLAPAVRPGVEQVFRAPGVDKVARAALINELRSRLMQEVRGRGFFRVNQLRVPGSGCVAPLDVTVTMERVQREVMNQMAVEEGLRVDGRGLVDLRPIHAEVNAVPVVHGSCLFQRGETQSLCTVTVGGSGDSQRTEGVLGEARKNLIVHYSFPAFSTKEIGRPGANPGRREVGHSALVERALAPVLPDSDAFPFSVRLNAQTLQSNGSSSMAAVCGGSLALADAGLALTRLVAGVSIGLATQQQQQQQAAPAIGTSNSSTGNGSIGGSGGGHAGSSVPPLSGIRLEGGGDGGESSVPAESSSDAASISGGETLDSSGGESDGCGVVNAGGGGGGGGGGGPPFGRYELLTDVQGLEDALGGMDFKVAGTSRGLTAAQLDVKGAGVPLQVLEEALQRAKQARFSILASMEAALAEGRAGGSALLAGSGGGGSLETEGGDGGGDDSMTHRLPQDESAPRFGSVRMDRDLVGRIIGPGGETIRRLMADSGARLEVDDDGLVQIFAPNQGSYDLAAKKLSDLGGTNIRPGSSHVVTVARLMDYGAFVEFNTGLQALLHISEFAHHKIKSVGEVLSEGQELEVKVLGRDSRGNLRLSRRALLPRPTTAAPVRASSTGAPAGAAAVGQQAAEKDGAEHFGRR